MYNMYRGRHPSQAQLMMAVSCIFPQILDMMYTVLLTLWLYCDVYITFLLTSNMSFVTLFTLYVKYVIFTLLFWKMQK